MGRSRPPGAPRGWELQADALIPRSDERLDFHVSRDCVALLATCTPRVRRGWELAAGGGRFIPLGFRFGRDGSPGRSYAGGMKRFKAVVLGASGFAGAEILRRLL